MHRYIRLIPIYSLSLLLYWFVMPVVGNGPIFFNYRRQSDTCSRYWWTHLLFINNFVPTKTSDDECMGWTWYLANDFQFLLVLPLFVWLLYNKRTAGLVFMGLVQFLSYAVNMAIVILYDLESSFFKADDSFYTNYYLKPYNRIAPFMIGVIVGLCIFVHKYEAPSADNKIKRLMGVINTSQCCRCVMYIVGSVIILGVVFIFYPLNNYPEDITRIFNALFLTFSKTLFIVGFTLCVVPL